MEAAILPESGVHAAASIANVPFSIQIYALNRVMTELEQQQFDEFCKQMQPPGE